MKQAQQHDDTPGVPEEEHVTKHGAGFGLHIKDSSFISDKRLTDEVEAVAKKHKIPYQRTILAAGGQDGAAAQQAAAGARAVGIVVGTRGTLVIDTGLGARNGQTIVREMQKVSRTPELFLATTHVQPEHDLGAGGFPPHTKMIRSQAQVKEIAESFNADLSDAAELKDALLIRRNVNWARWVRGRLDKPGTVLVAVGAGHLAGDQSVLNMLEKQGLKVTRVQ